MYDDQLHLDTGQSGSTSLLTAASSLWLGNYGCVECVVVSQSWQADWWGDSSICGWPNTRALM